MNDVAEHIVELAATIENNGQTASLRMTKGPASVHATFFVEPYASGTNGMHAVLVLNGRAPWMRLQFQQHSGFQKNITSIIKILLEKIRADPSQGVIEGGLDGFVTRTIQLDMPIAEVVDVFKTEISILSMMVRPCMTAAVAFIP